MDEDREDCNDLGGDSSEEDNEKQNLHVHNKYVNEQEEAAFVDKTESVSEKNTSKLLYHPVMVSTLLNIDFENYLVHESQNAMVAKQSTFPSNIVSSACSPTFLTSPISSQPFFFHDQHREFFILESQIRPRSLSLTDNIEFFRTRRDFVADHHFNHSSSDLAARSLIRIDENVSVSSTSEFRIPITSPLFSMRTCEFHKSVLRNTDSPVISDELEKEPTQSFNCARTISFHTLLCFCKLTCCCMCDVFCHSECRVCLNGVCVESVSSYPCKKSRILAPIKTYSVDKVRVSSFIFNAI